VPAIDVIVHSAAATAAVSVTNTRLAQIAFTGKH
jgi:hypothetical protein